MAKAMTGGLENMNQDPAQQIAVLMESPNLKHVGPAKVGGEETQHYKGTLSLKEMLDANSSFDALPEKDRKSSSRPWRSPAWRATRPRSGSTATTSP
ncbi:hypothetical protein ACFQVA_15585 [Actinomadura keratinilytica]